MKLWLVRHARPLVDQGRCYGATDLPADPVLTLDAATALAALLPTGLPVLSSPLRRCTGLALALHALRPDLGWQADARLAEMNFGCWEGWRWSDIPQDEFRPWTADFHNYRFGGSESVGELLVRVADVRSDAAGTADEGVWITHAGVIRAACVLAQGVSRIDVASDWPRSVVSFGACQSLAW